LAKVIITESDWLDALAKLSLKSDAGFTSEEWADRMGVSIDSARAKLRQAFRLGWLVNGKRTDVAMNGRKCTRDVYRVVRPKK
jgi:hypothetical protein